MITFYLCTQARVLHRIYYNKYYQGHLLMVIVFLISIHYVSHLNTSSNFMQTHTEESHTFMSMGITISSSVSKTKTSRPCAVSNIFCSKWSSKRVGKVWRSRSVRVQSWTLSSKWNLSNKNRDWCLHADASRFTFHGEINFPTGRTILIKITARISRRSRSLELLDAASMRQWRDVPLLASDVSLDAPARIANYVHRSVSDVYAMACRCVATVTTVLVRRAKR